MRPICTRNDTLIFSLYNQNLKEEKGKRKLTWQCGLAGYCQLYIDVTYTTYIDRQHITHENSPLGT